jgi:hypothetical protein
MWQMPQKPINQIVITIEHGNLSCAWIHYISNTIPALKSHTTGPLDTLCYTSLVGLIQKFVTQHSLKNCFVTFALGSPFIYEEFIRLPAKHPTIEDFKSLHLQKKIVDYRYVHTFDDGDSLFYLCAIAPNQLFLLELVCKKVGIHLLHATSSYMALVSAYKKIFGSAYRQTQLALDLIRTNYHIDTILVKENLSQLLKTTSCTPSPEKKLLAVVIGTHFQQFEKE